MSQEVAYCHANKKDNMIKEQLIMKLQWKW